MILVFLLQVCLFSGVLWIASNALRSSDKQLSAHLQTFQRVSGVMTPMQQEVVDQVNVGLSEEELATGASALSLPPSPQTLNLGCLVEGSVLGKGITQGELHKTYHDQSGKKRPKHNHEIKEQKDEQKKTAKEAQQA
jgi:hypothetical protein